MGARGGLPWIASYPKSGNTLIRLMIRGLMEGAPTPLSALDHPQMTSLRGLYQGRHGDGAPPDDMRQTFTRIRALQTHAAPDGDLFLKTHAAAVRPKASTTSIGRGQHLSSM